MCEPVGTGHRNRASVHVVASDLVLPTIKDVQRAARARQAERARHAAHGVGRAAGRHRGSFQKLDRIHRVVMRGKAANSVPAPQNDNIEDRALETIGYT